MQLCVVKEILCIIHIHINIYNDINIYFSIHILMYVNLIFVIAIVSLYIAIFDEKVNVYINSTFTQE